ncbi:MAG: CBS domain-containing protein [Candidatus Omnitrophica bacterium]|nr:CBS domain-containing protein [Candidatus Omnitrophota bacterium]
MKGSIRLFRIFGISINIHVTFLLLLLLFLSGGVKWLFILVAIFFFVTMHELCHSLVAKRFGITVREITLLPIGGIASMTGMPEKPLHELLISIAGPLFNIVIVLVFYFPLKILLGAETLLHPLSTATWPLTIAYVYWINLILAAFNLLPAFPMDGGRILRSILAQKVGYQKATRIAVNFGHIFALAFAYFGIVRFNIILIAIAIFIYMAASGEEMQVDVKETLKKFRVRDILSRDFLTLDKDATLSRVLELIFHSHQEDFPVMEGGRAVGFVTRQDIISGIHQHGMEKKVGDIMRKSFPVVKETDPLIKVHAAMQAGGMSALPVVRNGEVIGVVTLEDISRVYSIASHRV